MFAAAAPSAADRGGPGPRASAVVVALLAALHAAPFMVTFVEGDFARDLDQAARLVEGAGWPMRGPVLAWTLHLGPVWYWLLALPLAATHSIAVAVALVALLSALQFPLAYRLGTEAAGRAFGLAFAACLGLPGLATLQGLWIAHPSLVPTAMLAVAWCSWRAWTRASPGAWVAAMLASSLALHAHPTALPVLALPALAAGRALRAEGGVRMRSLALGIAAFLAPFAPLAFGSGAGDDALGRFASIVSTGAARFSATRWADALASVAWRVPDAIAGMALTGRPGAPLAFRVALAAMLVLALAGSVRALAGRATGLRLPVLASAAALVLTVMAVVAVRDSTRFYMLYAALPPFAAWLAASAMALPGVATAGVGLRMVPAMLALALAVAVSGAWTLRAVGGEVRVPAVLSAAADLSATVPRGHLALSTLSPLDLDRIGRRVCADGTVRAFGELAGVLDMLVNVPGRLACGGASRVVLGGAGEGSARYLVVADALPAGVPYDRLGAFAYGPVDRVVAPGAPIELPERAAYPWRPACGPPGPVEHRFTARGPGVLVVANALAATCPMSVVRISRDGADATTVERADSRVVAIPPGESAWEIVVASGDPRGVQVYTIAAPR